MTEINGKRFDDGNSNRTHSRNFRRRRRLIRFADEIVSETRLIPRIPAEDVPNLFFTVGELEQSLQEYRLGNECD